MEIPERGIKLKESDYVQAGLNIVDPIELLEGSPFQVGLAVCYDLRFPELSLSLCRKGANILTFPSAFTVPTGDAGHWTSLLKARAIGQVSRSLIFERELFVVAVVVVGIHSMYNFSRKYR